MLKLYKGLVVLAEDEDGVRNIFAQILQAAGYRVEAFADGKSAICFLEQSSLPENETPVAVVTDFHLKVPGNAPQINGDQVLIAVRECLPGVPCILASGQDISEDKEDFDGRASDSTVTSLFDSIVRKPCDAMDIVTAVGQVVAANKPAAAQSAGTQEAPAAEPPRPEARSPMEHARPKTGNARSVVIVEREPGTRALVKYVLSRDGFDILGEFENWDQANEALSDLEAPDLVVTGGRFGSSAFEGAERLEALKKDPRFAKTKGILVTGESDYASAELARDSRTGFYYVGKFQVADAVCEATGRTSGTSVAV